MKYVGGILLFFFVLSCRQKNVGKDLGYTIRENSFHNWFQKAPQQTLFLPAQYNRDSTHTNLSSKQVDSLFQFFENSSIKDSFHHSIALEPISELPLYPTWYIELGQNYRGYVLNTQAWENNLYASYLLLYNKKNKRIESIQELAYWYAAGGNEGQKRSWVVDLEQDGQFEVVTSLERRRAYDKEGWFVIETTEEQSLYCLREGALEQVALSYAYQEYLSTDDQDSTFVQDSIWAAPLYFPQTAFVKDSLLKLEAQLSKAS